jgi:hypothetical protein
MSKEKIEYQLRLYVVEDATLALIEYARRLIKAIIHNTERYMQGYDSNKVL